MQPKNIKEFKELILRYESITLEEIEKNFNKKELTGFGSIHTCTLCQSTVPDTDTDRFRTNCKICVYFNSTQFYIYEVAMCFKGINKSTYYGIEQAKTPKELKKAYMERAKHMRNILKNYYNENNT